MTASRLQIYKCQVCGIVVEVLDGGAGEVVCCGRPMQRMAERTGPEAARHEPRVEPAGGGARVRVGRDEPHPMLPKHFIQWIEVVADGRTCRQFLRPGDPPEASFPLAGQKVEAREFCNVHGLWKETGP